jgi:ketosteroid isomerase-like protein
MRPFEVWTSWGVGQSGQSPFLRVNRAESFLVDGNRSAINWVYEFIDHEGRSYLRDEIAYQVWQDGKIIQERFFYDPAGPKS